MFKIVLCLSAVFLTTAVFCASDVDDDNSNRKPGHCRYNGVDIKEGEWIPADLGHCYEHNCWDAAKNVIGSTGCGTFMLSPESKCKYIEEDVTKLFPECCPRADCPEDE